MNQPIHILSRGVRCCGFYKKIGEVVGENTLTNIIIGVIVIGTLWWLFKGLNETTQMNVDNPILITVSNQHFQPALIQVPAGKPFKLHFMRTDNSSCSDSVAFPQFRIAYQLPLNQKVEVSLPALKKGDLDFSCMSGTNRGKIMVT